MRTRVGVVVLLTILISSGEPTLGLAQAEELVFEETKLTASDGGPASWFGRSLAISGDTAVIGGLSNDLESVYVFARGVDGEWTEEAKLTASDPGPFTSFGLSVAVSGDTVVVGDDQDDDLGHSSGSVYVFTRIGGIWAEEAKLTASDGTVEMFFGYSVGVSGDTAIVGAYGDEPFGDNSGSAYIFTRSGGEWTEQAKLTNSNGAPNDFFGWWVGLSGDTGVVCAYGLNSAHVFSASGSVWTEEAELTASDAGSEFCRSAALSGDTLVVGDTFNQDVGAAYVFFRSGSTWTQEAKLTASDGTELQEFGWSVGVSGDTLVAGAPDSWADESGSAYLFQRTGSGWSEQGKLIVSDGEVYDWLGSSVGVSGDTLMLGSPGDDDFGVEFGVGLRSRAPGGLLGICLGLVPRRDHHRRHDTGPLPRRGSIRRQD